MKRTAAEAIIATLHRGPKKKGLTAAKIADRAGLNLNTTRTTVGTLVLEGSVTLIGRDAPSFGRPANLYVIA
jgi:DNA-binding IclR family transcriptional regulator